jgi:hypothetical protein
MDYKRFGDPVELKSKFLLNTIYKVDDHISKLEELVQEQRDEIDTLLKEKAERSSQMLRDAQAKVSMQLSQILAFANSEPPVSEGMGLDAVLILKHLESLVHEVREGGMWHDEFFDKVEQYVEACMQKAKQLPTGDSNEPSEG